MSEENVEIGLEVVGDKDAQSKIDQTSKTAEEAQKRSEKATRNSTAATKDNTSATENNAEALKSLGDAATAATKARQAHEQATRAHSESLKAQAEAMGYVKKSSAEMSADLKRAVVYADKLKSGAQSAGGALEGLETFSQAANTAQTSLAQLMSGNVVGAFKSAVVAVKQFTSALVMNPILLAIAAVTAAVAAMTKGWIDAKKAKDDYARDTAALDEMAAKIEQERGGNGDIGNLSDAELERRRKAAEEDLWEAQGKTDDALDMRRRTAKAKADTGMMGHAAEAVFGWTGAGVNARDARAQANLEDAHAREQNARESLKAIEAEQARRMDARNSSKAEDAAKVKASADRQRQQAEEVADRRKNFERDLQQAKLEAGEGGKMAGLEYRRDELLKDRSALEEKLAPMREMGFALDPDDEKQLLDINEKLLQVTQQISAENQRITTEKNQQKEADEKKVKAEKAAQAAWMRGRKLDKMSGGDRVSFINDEISALRQQPGTIENRERMRKLVDERDAAQKDVDAIKEKKQDFLHRNDTDAQKLARIGKELGATDDQSKMLELMMAGEDVAESYQEPMTKRQQRRAEKKAARDEKAAMKEAHKFRKQVADIEAKWKAGDESAQEAMAQMAAGGNKSALEKIATSASKGNKSAQELAAKLTSDKNGVPSAIQSKGGKLVEVKGQDRTNQLLETIAKALS